MEDLPDENEMVEGTGMEKMTLAEWIAKFKVDHPGMVERARCERMRDEDSSEERFCTKQLPCDVHADRCVYCGCKHPWVFAEHECPDSMGYDAASLAMTMATRGKDVNECDCEGHWEE